MPSAKATGELSASLSFSKLQLLSQNQAAVSQMYAVSHIGNRMTKKRVDPHKCTVKAERKKEVLSLYLKDRTFNKDLGTKYTSPSRHAELCQLENCSLGFYNFLFFLN